VTIRRVRSQLLFETLRNFCLGSFFALAEELERGADMPVALAEHGGVNRPTLYEYRPLVAAFVEPRASWLGQREDALSALAALKDEVAAGIFACPRKCARRRGRGLRRTILVPLLVGQQALRRLRLGRRGLRRRLRRLERSLFGACRDYAAVTPLVGASAGAEVELGRLRVRPAAAGEFTTHWPTPVDCSLATSCVSGIAHLVLELERRLPATPGGPTRPRSSRAP
jgi:hypothetical protein